MENHGSMASYQYWLVRCDCELALHSKHQEYQTPTLLMVAHLSIAMREPETEGTFHPTPENALGSRKAPWVLWTWACDSGWVISTCERREQCV